MNTENLKEFIVLAETKNFWEASERLYMNQSTLSKHIKNLESELGISLFTRTTRRVELTNYGRIFLPYAKSVIRSEFEGLSAIRRLQNIENGLLTIGVIPSMPQYHITQFLTDFQKAYPQKPLSLTAGVEGNLSSMLLRQLKGELPGTFRMDVSGTMQSLTDSIRRSGKLNLKAETGNLDFLLSMLPAAERHRYNIPSGIKLTGEAALKNNEYKADLLLREDKGKVLLTASFNPGKEAYKADLKVDSLEPVHFIRCII